MDELEPDEELEEERGDVDLARRCRGMGGAIWERIAAAWESVRLAGDEVMRAHSPLEAELADASRGETWRPLASVGCAPICALRD